jgi:hypothetical protein
MFAVVIARPPTVACVATAQPCSAAAAGAGGQTPKKSRNRSTGVAPSEVRVVIGVDYSVLIRRFARWRLRKGLAKMTGF